MEEREKEGTNMIQKAVVCSLRKEGQARWEGFETSLASSSLTKVKP